VVTQLLIGVWLVGMFAYGGYRNWFEYGGGRQKSPLYGIWNVDTMSVDGVIRSPLLTDYGRWHRVVFELPTTMTFQRMNDTFSGFAVVINEKHNSIVMSKRNDKKWNATLIYKRPSSDRLKLDGKMDGHTVSMDLSRFDRNQFLLVSRGFHWIQEAPFNR
jgi:hypothetical protein